MGVVTAVGPTALGGPTAAAATCGPSHISTTPDTGLNSLFQNYGNSGTGTTWTGGDGTESVTLPDGRVLWLFDDSLLGKVTNGQRRQREYIHNSLVIESNGALSATLYTAGRKPSAYVSPKAKRPGSLGFFPGGTIVNGSSLQVLMQEVKFKRLSHGRFGIVSVGDALGIFSLPSLAPVAVFPLPASSIDWSAGLLTDSGFTYIYGTGSDNVYAARVPGTDLTQTWNFYNGSGWTSNAASAVPIENNVARQLHLGVAKVSGSFGTAYALVSNPSLTANAVTTAFGCSPVGPFSTPVAVYTTPEPSTYPAKDEVVTYNAHAHPELSPASNELVVSYDCDPLGPKGLSIRDASIYRPRFIDITMS